MEDSMNLRKGKLDTTFHHVSSIEIEFLRAKFDSQKNTRLGELVLRLASAYEQLKAIGKNEGRKASCYRAIRSKQADRRNPMGLA